MTTSTDTQVTYHEVVFGAEEHERQIYPDYGDGSFISRTADARATSFFLSMVKAGVRVGFYTNGVLVAGEEPIWPAEDEA